MNPSRPVASHVAVRDGRILGVGSLAELAGWGDHRLDTRFADKILMPGLVEGHSHVMEGTFWSYALLRLFRPHGPERQNLAGCQDHVRGAGPLGRRRSRSGRPDTTAHRLVPGPDLL